MEDFFDEVESRVGIVLAKRRADYGPADVPVSVTNVASTTLVTLAIATMLASASFSTETAVAAPAIVSVGVARFPGLYARIARIAALQDGWLDGAGASPSRATTERAREVARCFEATDIPTKAEPQVAALEEGGYQFEWRNEDREIFVGVTDAEEMGILEVAPDHECEFDGSIADLVRSLRWFSKAT